MRLTDFTKSVKERIRGSFCRRLPLFSLMNENKKGFNLFPEYVWMIFVGMLLALLILTNVIPGRADEVSPTPTVTPVPTSALDPTDACLPLFVVGSYFVMFDESSSEVLSYFQQYDNDEISLQDLLDLAYWYRERSPGDNSAFYRDVKISLTQLSSQFPGFFISLVDVGATKSAFDEVYSIISEVGIPISLGYLDYSSNRVLYMANAIYTDAPVWVWNSAVPTPTVTPTPAPSEEYGFVFYVSGRYFACLFETSDFGKVVDLNLTGLVSRVLSDSGTTRHTFLRPALVNIPGGSYSTGPTLSLTFGASSLSNVRFYAFGTSLVSSDFDYIKENYSPLILSANPSSFPLLYQDSWLYGCVYNGYSQPSDLFEIVFYQGAYNTSSFDLIKVSFPGYGYSSSGSSSKNYVNSLVNSASEYELGYLPYRAMYVGINPSSEPSLNEPSPTPGPTATPEPLPTSGESIHIIMPTGTPTPTPPFSVPGGLDGASGSDSPGSIGSGLSSGQTSGVLQAWNMYVLDNPAMIFLTSTFQSLPPELLYPLYILLFILLLLAVIRLFVHFSGG